jgi:hypothetical protein
MLLKSFKYHFWLSFFTPNRLLRQWIHLPTRLVGLVSPTIARAAVLKETYSRLYESVTNIFVRFFV